MQPLSKKECLFYIIKHSILMKNLGLLIAFIGLATLSFGQITVANTQTPEQLVQDVLLGSGIVATNVTFNGSAVDAQTPQVNASFFDANGTIFPIDRGVILTNGAGTVAAGPNDETAATDATGTVVITDVDMADITPNTLTNGAVLEFDFIATGDTLNFNYMFASEEYPADFGTSFYDVFGFFISGAGFAGPYTNGGVNIANTARNKHTDITFKFKSGQ